MAHPAFDHLRLWPSSESLLFGRTDVLERITPTWDKRRLPLNEAMFATSPHRVGVIYLLQRTARDEDPAPLRTLSGAEALLALTASTYCNYLLDAPTRAHELQQLGALLRAVAARRLASAGDELLPDALCDLILRDVGAVRPGLAGTR